MLVLNGNVGICHSTSSYASSGTVSGYSTFGVAVDVHNMKLSRHFHFPVVCISTNPAPQIIETFYIFHPSKLDPSYNYTKWCLLVSYANKCGLLVPKSTAPVQRLLPERVHFAIGTFAMSIKERRRASVRSTIKLISTTTVISKIYILRRRQDWKLIGKRPLYVPIYIQPDIATNNHIQ